MTSVGFKKFVFSLLFSLAAFCVQAQFTKVSIGINGLTCSQCSRSVEIQLRKLPFVKEVNMDLERTEGVILFKANKKVNIASIAEAVKDAGFSVRFLKAEIERSDIDISEQGCFTLDGNSYNILRPLPLPGKPLLTLQFLGKNFIPGNELKKYKLPAATPCKGKVTYFALAN